MNQKKYKLMVSIILVLAILLLTTKGIVFATDTTTYLNWDSIGGNSNNSEIPVVNDYEDENENNYSNTSAPIKDADIEEKNTSNQNIANTGIEDLFGSRSTAWIVLGFCIISAVFAYKKIKEYNID